MRRYVVNREHAGRPREKQRLAAGARGVAPGLRENTEAREGGQNALGAQDAGVEGQSGLVEYQAHVLLGRVHAVGVALVERVRRAEQEHAEPWDCERHAHAVVRHGHRRRPVAVEREQDVHALREGRRRRGSLVGQAAHPVDPRTGGVHDAARLHLDMRSVEHVAYFGSRCATRNRS
jgi:hypothetical protein